MHICVHRVLTSIQSTRPGHVQNEGCCAHSVMPAAELGRVSTSAPASIQSPAIITFRSPLLLYISVSMRSAFSRTPHATLCSLRMCRWSRDGACRVAMQCAMLGFVGLSTVAAQGAGGGGGALPGSCSAAGAACSHSTTAQAAGAPPVPAGASPAPATCFTVRLEKGPLCSHPTRCQHAAGRSTLNETTIEDLDGLEPPYKAYTGIDYGPLQVPPPKTKIANVTGIFVETPLECAVRCNDEKLCNAASFYGENPAGSWPAGGSTCWLKTISVPCEVPPDYQASEYPGTIFLLAQDEDYCGAASATAHPCTHSHCPWTFHAQAGS